MDRWLENDLLVKIISVALAVVIWLQVAGATPATVSQRTVYGVPVTYRNLPPDLAVSEVSPETVDVTVRGDNRDVVDLTRDTLAATVNLSHAKAGRLQFDLAVAVPRGVQVVQVSPAQVTVVLEPLIDRQRPVTVRVNGSPADGYKAGTPVADPASVIVHGPESDVDKVTAVVASVAVGGATGDVTASATPVPVDAHGQAVAGVVTIPDHVQVTVPVRPAVTTRELPVAANLQGSPASGYGVAGVTVTPATVVLSGPATVLAGLGQAGTAPVDIAGARSDVTATVAVVLPDGVTAAQPGRVTVTVHIVAGGR